MADQAGSAARTADYDLLRRWGRYGTAIAVGACVHQLVAAQAERVPDAIAVSLGPTTLTYRTLDSLANGLAGLLGAAGAGPGQVVGVLADRSPELIVALLAVLKSGAAYLALESDVPMDRCEQLLANARVAIVLTSGEATRSPAGVRVIPVGRLSGLVRTASPPPVSVRPDDLAYVSYTSGSSGAPKGVAVPHAAVARLLRPDWADFLEDDTFLQLAPVAFDASTLEIWAPLTAGARLAIHPAGRADPDGLATTLLTQGVTVLWLTAGLFHQMVASRLDGLGGLRHLIAGGDVISAKAVRALLTRHPQLTFTNGYGPTENTTFTACWTSRLPPGAEPTPIGHPVSGTTVAILDDVLRPVPLGCAGELYAGGAGLARCYLGQPAATAERFVADPLSAHPGARMYRTGDLTRWQPGGIIEFLGRADRQVKIRGYRVEPSEVEAALEGAAEVCSALVVAEPDGAGGTRLAAFVTPEDQHANPGQLAGQLRTRLLHELQPYLVPARLTVMHRLPLNRNGKVDRALFESAGRAPRAVINPYVAPREPLESFLAELWVAMLEIETVGTDDDFFEVGGHSLAAGELLIRVQREFGVTLPARVFYLHPTVAELAGTVRDLLGEPAPDTEGIQP